jgi:hypothetical protein
MILEFLITNSVIQAFPDWKVATIATKTAENKHSQYWAAMHVYGKLFPAQNFRKEFVR